jgi:multiple sugar transport system permease protein
MSLSEVSLQTLNSDWAFVGLENFKNGIADGSITRGLRLTVIYTFIVAFIGVLGGFTAAVILRGKGRYASVVLAIMVFIWALPPVVNGSVWKFLLAEDGLLNLIANSTIEHTIPFLYSHEFALYSVAAVNAWVIIPFNALVFRAAILGIDEEIFEAAKLDGASKLQEIRFIMIPSVKPASLVLTILTIVNAFRSYDFIYVMTQGGPGTATQTLPYASYSQAFVQYNFGAGSATAVVAVVLVVILAVIYARNVFREERS